MVPALCLMPGCRTPLIPSKTKQRIGTASCERQPPKQTTEKRATTRCVALQRLYSPCCSHPSQPQSKDTFPFPEPIQKQHPLLLHVRNRIPAPPSSTCNPTHRVLLLGHGPATLFITVQPCRTNLAIIIGNPPLLPRSAGYSALSVHRRTTKSHRKSNTGSNMGSPNGSQRLATL